MGKRKHLRVNRDQRDTARRLVGLWYVGRCDEHIEKYRSVNAIPVSPSGALIKFADRWTAWTTEYKQRGLYPSASGKEKHLPNLESLALCTPMNLDSKGGYHPNRNRIFAGRVMRHVMAVDPASHAALEMDAAGYNRVSIAKELDCGEKLAEAFRDAGLSVVTSCIILKLELGWATNDGKRPNPYAYN